MTQAKFDKHNIASNILRSFLHCFIFIYHTIASATTVQKKLGNNTHTYTIKKYTKDREMLVEKWQQRGYIVGARVLPGLGRRLYGKEGGRRGHEHGGRREGAVTHGEEAAAMRGRRLRFRVPAPRVAGQQNMSYCLIPKGCPTIVYIISRLLLSHSGPT